MALRFSIIIATRNRPVLLDRCLTAMGQLDFPRESFEVLVVDDGSDPAPSAVLTRHAASLPLRTFRTEGVGPATARNLALLEAVGEYVVFTDDDCRPTRGWLAAYDEAARKYPEAALGGSILDDPENGLLGRTSQMLVSYLYDYNASVRDLRFFCSNNLVFPRKRLLTVGGFDESFPLAAAEDRYLCSQWLQRNEMEFVPAAKIEHRQTFGVAGFFRQHLRYGRGACHYWLRRQASEDVVHRIQPFRFYAGMFGYPFGKMPFPSAVVASLALAVSQVAVVLGYLAEKLVPRSGLAWSEKILRGNK